MPEQKKTLRLGIDAKWFFEGPPSGNMVVKNLVNEMLRNNNGRFEICLFFSIKHKKQALEYFPGDTKMLFLPAMPNILSNMFVVPFMAWIYNMDVMLFQNFGSLWPPNIFKIVYIHDVLFLDYPQYYSPLQRAYFRFMKKLASKAGMIITISETEKKRLLDNHINTQKGIAVVHHGINKDFKPAISYNSTQILPVLERYKLPEHYLLYVGRVDIRKNLKNLLSALFLLHDTSLKLVITGEQGHTASGLKKYISQTGLSDRVIFTGHVSEEELHIIYARATVFCFPSYAEGFGLPPLEAMQCGVPVVVSDRTAMPEVCGNAAMYIDPDDAKDIARKINSLLDNDQLYKEKQQDGLKHSRNFSWERSANQLLDIITETYAA